MTTNCPNCNKPLKGKEGDPLICYSCGTISTKDKIVQIGIGKYKFNDDHTDYITVFESVSDRQEFKNLAIKNKEDYKYCRIETPAGIETIV